MTWDCKPFASEVDDQTGGNVKTQQKEYLPNGAYPIVDQGQQLIGGYTDDEKRLCKADLPVIIFGDHTKIFKYIDFSFCLGADGTKVLRPKNRANPKYLYYALQQAHMPEAGYSRHFKFLKQFQIPLPPLDEQKRIAAILDKADELRRLRQRAIDRLNSLGQAIFYEMFGDASTNPHSWPKESFDEIVEIPSSLVDPKDNKYSKLLHYGPDRIERDTGRLLPAKSAEEDGVESGKFLFQPGMLIYSKIRPYLNKVAMVDFEGLCSADVYPLQIKNNDFTREFIWTVIRQKEFLSFSASFSGRANIPKINRKQLLSYKIISPPRDLQLLFAERIKLIEEKKEIAEKAQAMTDAIFASIQHRGFAGEL